MTDEEYYKMSMSENRTFHVTPWGDYLILLGVVLGTIALVVITLREITGT